MPRSKGAEAVDYGSLPDYIDDAQDTVKTRLETSPADDAITDNDDILRSEISDALTEIDGLEQKIPESSKTLLEKQKEKLMKLMEKGDFDKAKIFSSMVKDSLKAEAKFHEQFQHKREEIDFRLQSGFSEVAGTSDSTLEKVHKLHDRLKTQEEKGNFSEAAVLADRILDLFHNEHVNGETQSHAEQKKAEQRLTKLKDQLSAILKTIPNWREQPFILQGFDKIDLDEDAGNLEGAGQTIQYLIDSLAGRAKSDSRKFNSRDEEEAVQFLEGVTNRLEYGKNLENPIVPSKRDLAKIESARAKIVGLLNKGKAKQARDLAERLLQTVQQGISKPDFNKKRKFNDTVVEAPPAMREQSAVSSRKETRVGRKKTPTGELPVTEKLDLGDEGTGKFSYDEATQPGLEVANFDDEATSPGLDIDAEATIPRGIPIRREEENKNVVELARRKKEFDQNLENARRRDTRAEDPAEAGVFDALSLPPELLTETPRAPVAEANEPNIPDFADIIDIAPKKGLWASLKERFLPGAAEKQRRAVEKFLGEIAQMDKATTLENLSRFGVDLSGGATKEVLQTVTSLLHTPGEKQRVFKDLWTHYTRLQTREKNDWERAIPNMGFDEIYSNMKQFGINLERDEGKVETRKKIEALQKDPERGEIFRQLYGKYVELQKGNMQALAQADQKTVISFVKDQFGYDAKQYLKGNNPVADWLNNMRLEYSFRGRVLNEALNRLDALQKGATAEPKPELPKTGAELEKKLQTLDQIREFLKRKFELSMDENGKLDVQSELYLKVLSKEQQKKYEKSGKMSPEMSLLATALTRAQTLAAEKKSPPRAESPKRREPLPIPQPETVKDIMQVRTLAEIRQLIKDRFQLDMNENGKFKIANRDAVVQLLEANERLMDDGKAPDKDVELLKAAIKRAQEIVAKRPKVADTYVGPPLAGEDKRIDREAV